MKNYYEKKAENIKNKIQNCSEEQIQKLIEISLKEVAKDQKSACIDKIQEYDVSNPNSIILSVQTLTKVINTIHDTEIK